MPIHSVGYRAWQGRRVSSASRWSVIASTGIRRTWKSRWIRRMMFFAVLPMLFLAVPFFLFEQAVRNPIAWRPVGQFLRTLPQTDAIAPVFETDLSTASPEEIQEVRHQIWSYLLLTLFRYPQATLMVLVIGIAAPPLISHDVRSRAFLIYFSRPITRLEYILGKMFTVVFFLVMITTVPALLLYVSGVMLSPSPSVINATWDLPLRILIASITLILPTTSMALMFSSMTVESRYAGFTWFAVWILGHVIYSVVMTYTITSMGQLVEPGLRALLSPYLMLGVIQSWIFGLPTNDAALAPSVVLLSLTTVISLVILYHRVSAPMRA